MRALILHLGGRPGRTAATAHAAQAFRPAHVVISSETAPAMVLAILRTAGVDILRVSFDFTAWDTVSNLAVAWTWVRAFGYTDVVLVTDAAHMRRAVTIAEIVFACRGVRVHCVCAVDELAARQAEPMRAIARDVVKALVLRVTGWVPNWPPSKAKALAFSQQAYREYMALQEQAPTVLRRRGDRGVT